VRPQCTDANYGGPEAESLCSDWRMPAIASRGVLYGRWSPRSNPSGVGAGCARARDDAVQTASHTVLVRTRPACWFNVARPARYVIGRRANLGRHRCPVRRRWVHPSTSPLRLPDGDAGVGLTGRSRSSGRARRVVSTR
jgi:hypothetical protein